MEAVPELPSWGPLAWLPLCALIFSVGRWRDAAHAQVLVIGVVSGEDRSEVSLPALCSKRRLLLAPLF